MNFDWSIRHKIQQRIVGQMDKLREIQHLSPEVMRYVIQESFPGETEKSVAEGMMLAMTEVAFAHELLPKAASILFSHDQAEVFRTLANTYRETLDFRLPFPTVWLQFDRALPVKVVDEVEEDRLLGVLINQDIQVHDMAEKLISAHLSRIGYRPIGNPGDLVTKVMLFYADGSFRCISWSADSQQPMESSRDVPDTVNRHWLEMQNLIIACIGYINCENVYLERQAAPEKVNRKRAKRGKTQLDPYYVCRIRKTHTQPGASDGAGDRHVSFRFDVRGHFRRLRNGKTTWVRPHQRGLDHELYVPKAYAVK